MIAGNAALQHVYVSIYQINDAVLNAACVDIALQNVVNSLCIAKSF